MTSVKIIRNDSNFIISSKVSFEFSCPLPSLSFLLSADTSYLKQIPLLASQLNQ